MTLVLAVAGAPQVARAVRAVVVGERTRDYVEAARAAGAGPTRVLVRHLLPACTRSWWRHRRCSCFPPSSSPSRRCRSSGWGSTPPSPSWGTMLQEAANVRAIAEYPWVLAPAAAISLLGPRLQPVADGRDATGLP